MEGAAVRGRYMRTFVAAVERVPEGPRILGPHADWTSKIERAGPLDWLPVEANTELTRAVASGLGPRRTDGFFRALALESFETPLMRGLVSAVVAVVGNDPARFLDWYQRGFGLLFRGVGTWVVTERSATGATIEVTGLPAPCADEVWLASVASSLSALIVLAKRNGSVDYRWRKRPSDVDFRLVWTVDD